ncbi:ATP-binding protein [Peribacillus frigoritolerans]|uniref:ATP-binding protein n=1 Tax=Peribacillus frigoritolerans TaxID=450367 RepID=UPI0032B49C38
MAGKQDDRITELVGEWFLKTLPFTIPGSVIAWYYFKPDTFHEVFGPFYPAIKTGIQTLIIGVIATIIIAILRFLFNRHREKKRYQYYQILPHVDQSGNAASILEMVEQIAGYKRPRSIRMIRGREWFQWMIHRDKEGIKFYIGFPEDRKTGIIRTIQNAYPEAEIHEANHIQFPTRSAYSGRMVMDYKGIHEVKPLASFSGKNGIGNLISYMEPGTWIDITFSPSSPFHLMRKIKKSQKKMKNFHSKLSEMDSFEKNDLKSVSRRLTGKDKVYTVSVSIASESKQDGGVVQSIATTLGSIMNDENGLSIRRFPNGVEKKPYPFIHTMDWTGRELSNLLQLPSPNHNIFEEVPHLQKGERALDKSEMNNGITVGYMKHPIVKKRLVKVPYNIFREHWFMSGKTGSGKSSEILMILQSMIDDWANDPKSAPGFTLFDPAKETALTVISRLKKAESEGISIPWENVHYISLTKDEYPLALSILHKAPGEIDDIVKNNVINIIDTAIESNAPRAMRWIENAILALLQDKNDHSILGVNRMFQDPKFRVKIVDKIEDPVLKEEWLSYNMKDTDPTLDAIRTRMQPFQSSMYMRRMFGQTKFGLNLRKWMDEGHLVLIDMKDVDDTNIALTVGHMVTQYHQTAIKRQTGSKLHMLLVDEAHLAQIPIMDTIVAFDRKFGLGLGIITQYMDQLKPFLKKAIKGNMGTILSGTQGDESAAQVESMTGGRFNAQYVQNLPSNTVAVFTKDKVGGVNKITTCTVETEPPFVYKENGDAANYTDQKEMTSTFNWLESIALDLQKRDGEHYKKVDESIQSYLGYDKKDNKQENEGLFGPEPEGRGLIPGSIRDILKTEDFAELVEQENDGLFSEPTPEEPPVSIAESKKPENEGLFTTMSITEVEEMDDDEFFKVISPPNDTLRGDAIQQDTQDEKKVSNSGLFD